MIKEIIIKTEIIKILLRTYIETNKYTFIRVRVAFIFYRGQACPSGFLLRCQIRILARLASKTCLGLRQCTDWFLERERARLVLMKEFFWSFEH
jgi:hypothetical protein